MWRTLICLATCLLAAGCAEGRTSTVTGRTWVLAQLEEPAEAGDDADLQMQVRFVRLTGEAATWDLAGASTAAGAPPGQSDQAVSRMLRDAHMQDLAQTLATPTLVLRLGEESRVVITSQREDTRELLLVSEDGDWVVGTLPDGVLARATVADYDPSGGSGSVSFEFALQSAGVLEAHARQQSMPFRTGETFILAGSSPPSG